MDNARDLRVLIDSRTPVVVLRTVEEERAEEVVIGMAQGLGTALFIWTATDGMHRYGLQNVMYKTQEPMAALSTIGESTFDAIYLLKGFHRYLDDPLVVRKLQDISSDFRQRKRSIIILAPQVELPAELAAYAVVMPLELPSVEELKELIVRLMHQETERTDRERSWRDNLPRLLRRGAETEQTMLTTEEIDRFARALSGLTLFEAEQALSRALLDDNRLTAADFSKIVEAKKHLVERDGLLEYYHQDTSFADVGGMQTLKDWLNKRKNAWSDRAREFGLDPPRGVLLLGVQGCGKSLFAKAVAHEWSMPLLKFDVARLYTKYIGETESNIRKVMQVAEAMAPVTLWVDEIEKGFASSSSSESDGGVSRRVFGTFISWLQERKAAVFVVATANDVSALPPELLRKGRFDEIFFVDLPTKPERLEIFRIHLKRRKRAPEEFDLEAFAHVADGFSGAEIEQVIVSALYEAFAANKPLTTELILNELQKTRPLSVTRKEQVDELRAWARGRTVPAGL